MAVPPAVAGAPGVTGPAAGRQRRRTAVLIGLLAVLLTSLGCLAWLAGTRSVDPLRIEGEQAQVQQQRDLVRAQAEQFLLRMGAYGPDLLDDDGTMPEYRERVTEVITPKFAGSFDQQVTIAEQVVAQAEQSREVTVFGSGVAAIDEDTATALVAGAFTDSYAGGDPQAPSSFRLEVSLVSVDGEWLVDGFVPVTGIEERP